MENPFAKNCVDILTLRIEREEYSSRFYQAMSLWLDNAGYVGAAKAWKKDADGEMEHAQWAKDFLLALGVTPKLSALPEMPTAFEGLPDIIRKTFDHEIKITQECNDLANYAYLNGNHLLYQLALKYMTEQAEELEKIQTVLDKLVTFGEDKIALKLLDNDFAE